ncbi:MAG TPA: Ig-like domain-containing protein, partial [Pyrinomonadaceae bacterium]|nr:Ig-like domain-containing protein [Pyrinomonadaceae bacterium]
VWGVNDFSTGPGQGGRYNPQTDSWRPVTTSGAPVNRSYFTGVWTGTEMIIWGGQSNDATLQNTGGRYNPSTDTWRPTNTSGAPQARYIHTAVWTGSEMIVWGGSGEGLTHFNTGGRYNPANDTWRPTSTVGAPEPRRFHTAVWTGAEMIVWGGRIGDYNDSDGLFNTGGRYNPSTDAWTPTTTAGAPTPRFKHSAVWTGELMIVWGGIAQNAFMGFTGSTNTGGRYQPQTNAWTPTSTLRAPGRRHEHIAFWTGTGMLVWGGYAEDGSASHGGYYFVSGASPGNTPPTVRITSPSDSATFDSGANVQISAEASDTDGTVSVVQFYANDELIGSDTNAPFGYSWPGVPGGSYTLKAVATDDRGGATTSAPVSFTVSFPLASANLSLGVSDSPDPVAVGSNLTYTLTVNNSGQTNAPNVSVSATLPANATFVSATNNCTRDGNNVTCALGQLDGGANRAASIVVVPTVAGTLDFGASVASDLGDPDTSNNAAQAATDVHLRGTDVQTGDVLIGEFRAHGNASVDAALDDFVELYNNTDAPITVGPADASGGWSLVAREADGLPVVRTTIPKGTVIPARGHFLITAAAYSLGALAASDLPLAGNILDTGGLALFRTADASKFNETAERLDAVGFSNTSDGIYREGAGLAPVDAVQAEQSFVRKLNSAGLPQDTGDNAADFQLISKTPGSFGAQQALLGAPGPENTASPIQRNATIKPSLVDPACAGFGVETSGCARVRVGGTEPNAAFGTLTIRRRFTNKTGASVNRLRFRITDVTTLGTPGTSALADLRAIASTDVEALVGDNPVTIKGTRLESTHPLGGGVNSTLVLTLAGTSLAPNASIDVQFRLGVERNGAFRFFVNVEALTTTPSPGAAATNSSATKQSIGK